MNNPLVSVVVPVYNAEKYLTETVESIINQTYKNIEILLINHNSTDTSISIMSSFKDQDSRVIVINLDINKGGPAYPRNIGIKHSEGKYIAFIDSDDIWHKDKLQIQINHMMNNNLNFSSTGMSSINEMSININFESKILNFIRKNRNKSMVCDLIKYNFIATSSVVVNKEIISYFDESTELITVEDLYLWLTLLNNNKIRYEYLETKLLNYRVLSTSMSERKYVHKQRTKANLCILKFILNSGQYEYLNCFYNQIIKMIIMNYLKKLKK